MRAASPGAIPRGGAVMPAYVIVNIEVRDRERYTQYIQVAPESIARYGGRYIVRGGKTEVLEGSWQPKRFVMLEFESVERAKAWWDSEEYRGPKAMRQSAANTDLFIVEGMA
jgi:uncharacterized protein (DUF1330 family)